jgi:hypothetical protein
MNYNYYEPDVFELALENDYKEEITWEESIAQMEEDNRKDVLSFIADTLIEDVGNAELLDMKKIEKTCNKWFRQHKNDYDFCILLSIFRDDVRNHFADYLK